MQEALDTSKLNFNQDSLLLLNLSLAIIMFGVSLDLKVSDFRYIVKIQNHLDWVSFPNSFSSLC